MANNHEQFLAFNKTIKLDANCKETLRTNRKALRKRITKYFENNYATEIIPKFQSQGSFAMDTILNPLQSSKEKDSLSVYDLDDGVYFLAKEGKTKLSVHTYHKRVYDAVKDHTSIEPKDKTTCVRVEYIDGHHIDLPIYYKEKNKAPQLAHKSKNWIDSDPKEFYEWFNEIAKEKPQLRRIVRYLKAWSAYIKSKNENIKMPSGFVLTILAVNNYRENLRDDIAMNETLSTIYSKLDVYFSCCRPTTPVGEELILHKFTDDQKNMFLNKLKSFVSSASEAINETNPKNACLKWQKHVGNRFCCSNVKDEDEDAKSFLKSAKLMIDSKNA